MNQINQYFEASDNAEYVFFDSPHQCICKVTAGTVRGIAAGATVYAAAPHCIAVAAVAGSSAIAIAPDALAIALVAGSSASAAADGAYADALDVGSLAQAFVAGAVAKTQIGTALGLAAGAWVIEKYPPSDRERDVPGVIYSNLADNFSVARAHGVDLNPSPWPTKIDDGCPDLGVIIAYDMYAPPGAAYPWQNDYCYLDDPDAGGYSIAMTGKQILNLSYTGPGMKLRDAIRHAEILGDDVPDEAYEKLQTFQNKPDKAFLKDWDLVSDHWWYRIAGEFEIHLKLGKDDLCWEISLEKGGETLFTPIYRSSFVNARAEAEKLFRLHDQVKTLVNIQAPSPKSLGDDKGSVDEYEIRGCKLKDDGVEEVADNEAEFYGLYKRPSVPDAKGDRLGIHVSDHPTRMDATTALEVMRASPETTGVKFVEVVPVVRPETKQKQADRSGDFDL